MFRPASEVLVGWETPTAPDASLDKARCHPMVTTPLSLLGLVGSGGAGCHVHHSPSSVTRLSRAAGPLQLLRAPCFQLSATGELPQIDLL